MFLPSDYDLMIDNLSNRYIPPDAVMQLYTADWHPQWGQSWESMKDELLAKELAYWKREKVHSTHRGCATINENR